MRTAFKEFSEIVRNPQRMRDIENIVNKNLIPLVEQYEVKLDAMMKSIAATGRAPNDPKARLRVHLNSFLKNVERITNRT